MSRNKLFKYIYFSIIMAIALLLRLYFFNSSPLDHSDASARLWMAQEWGRGFFQIKSGAWLPFHFYILGNVISFFGNPLITGRIVTIIFSVATLLPLYLIVDMLNLSKQNKFISIFIYTISMYVILLSVQPFSESVFVFFILFSFYFYLKYMSCGFKYGKWFLLTVIFLNLASGIRYEAWLFTLFLFSVILFKKKYIEALIFLASSYLFPLSWIRSNCIYSTGCFSFFQVNIDTATYYRKLFDISFWKVLLWISLTIVKLLGFYTIPLYILGFIIFLKTRKYFFLLAVGFIPCLLFLQIFFGSMEWLPNRYLVLFYVLSIPLYSEALILLWKLSKYHKLIFITLTMLTLNAFYLRFSLSMPYPENRLKDFPTEEIEIINWIKNRTDSDLKLLIEEGDLWRGERIAVYTGLNKREVQVVDNLKLAKYQFKYIHPENFSYLIATDTKGSGLQKTLGTQIGNCDFIQKKDYSLQCIYKNRLFKIYEVIRKK